MKTSGACRVAVTGGAGFIGSHLVEALVAGGYEVLVVDDLSTGRSDNIATAAAFSHTSILDPSLTRVLADFTPDSIVHLAAQTSVNSSVEDPERDRLINIEGTRAVAKAASAVGARRMLFASTAAVYGEPTELPLRESSPTAPANPYGSSKLSAEAVAADELAGMVDLACLRLANVFGPRQDSQGEGGVVAVFSDRIVSGDPIVVYGDGSQTRDFIYVGDVVRAFVTGVEAPGPLAGEGSNGSCYNISTGTETSVRWVADALASAGGRALDIRFADLPPGDVARSSLDPSRAQAAFGWRAEMPLERGLALTVDWFARR